MSSGAAAVKARARELGFDLAGVARAGPAPGADAFLRWIAEGRHGGMDWLARDPERRGDPSRLLPGARSVLMVARSYASPEPSAADPLAGRISRYAWGDDYHEVLADRLHDLRRFVEGLGGRAKVCVDTAAILEKPWAQEAGLGWIGKHTNLISPALGSWFFLGALVTDLDLEPDAPFGREQCGSCRACIDVCPTQAIPGPFELDARRCISYLTIELRGAIPVELRAGTGNWVFGCDLCQDVCPWNSKAPAAGDPAFAPREGARAPALAELMAEGPEGFRRRFKGSAVKRAKPAGFLRNVAVALGNSGDPRAVGPLVDALEHPEALVRGHAAWALGRLGRREPLEARRERETDASVLAEIDAALGGRGT